MTDTALTLDVAHDVIDRALKAGADAAEAVLSRRSALSVSVRLGELEEVEREESRDLGLRVFIGRKQAVVSASDLSEPTRVRLVERAVAMARLAPEDPYAGLAPQDRLAGLQRPDLDLFDPTDLDAAALEARARAAEASARAVPGVTNSNGGEAGLTTGEWALVTSHGFEGHHRGSAFSLSARVIAERDGVMEVAGDGRATRHLSDLEDPLAIGAEAGRRAVAQLGARKLSSRSAPIILENRIATQLIGPLIGAIAGPAVARGVSFLKDQMGQRVLSDAIQLIDDPLRLRGLGSTPFDDEGVAVSRQAIVADGVLQSWLLNTSSAAQLGLETTGHASRGLAGPAGVSGHNLTIEPGTRDLEGLMADAGSGLLVTSMFGPSLNPNTGDWSAGISGQWFENGQIVHAVNEVTIAGNLLALYQRLIPGSDLELRSSSNSPSLLIDAVAIAGA
ncbi:MAG: TldD/PmbA family protein [Caulobacterales bacterium]|nr:TldD/PmbA family protein [Caulobacterales bacterium]